MFSLMKRGLCLLLAGTALHLTAEQIKFDFAKDKVDEAPPHFVNAATGSGALGKWIVTEEAVPPVMAPVETNANITMSKRAVLEVHSFTMDADHMPVLLYTNEILSDFTFTTRMKISGGIVDPSAGIVFRATDASNYYVLRASAGGNLLFFKVVAGTNYQNLGVGVRVPFEKDQWRELKVNCNGNQIRCYLDNKLAIPPYRSGTPTNDLAVNDTTFSHGWVGFWGKADTKAFFADARIDYSPKVPYVQTIMRNLALKYPHLVGLRVYARKTNSLPVVIGSINEKDLGLVGTKTEADVLERGSIYYEKQSANVEVTLPLRDRNGEVVGALKVKMKSFKGEMQNTAIARATIVKLAVEGQVETMESITE